MADPLAPFKGETSNHHVVDRLAMLRQHIRAAQDLEKSLKDEVAQLMGSADSLGGDEFIARQKVTTRKGPFDEKRLAEVLGDMVERYRKPETTVYRIDTVQREANDG